MPKRIRDLTALTPATGDYVAIDRPGGATGRATIAATPTPNTVALRNAQGVVLNGISIPANTVLTANGAYQFGGVNKWLKIAQWTGIFGSHKGLFADLYIVRLGEHNLGTRIRARLGRIRDGSLFRPMLSLANDYIVASDSGVIKNAILLEKSDGTYELWLLADLGPIYVSGVVGVSGTDTNLELTPYGDVSSLVEDSAPTSVPDRLYLEWTTVTKDQTLFGPGYIVVGSRTPTWGYIRYDNGIQVCWATITVGSGIWTFPAAFASTPQVQATAQDSNPRLATITSVSTTAAGVLRTDLSGATQFGTVHLWAIGLWK